MSYTESVPVTITPRLEGVWLHAPEDPEGTALHLRYGGTGRTEEIDVPAGESWYAGRTFPVVDFGEHESERVPVRMTVPAQDGTSGLAALRALVRRRSTLSYRDGRGRSVIGYLSGLRVQDEEWGASVSFTVNRLA